MKLLIITQVIDTEHPILGFFHRWVVEFAKHCEQVHVICLQEGKHSLPANVHVHSLGKEVGKGRLIYLYRFYKLIWQLRHEYDNVFVHMNQIYVILGAPFWRPWGKKVGLWYAHGAVTNSLKIAVSLSNIVFTSTPQGMRVETSKLKIVGQGIDTELFRLTPKDSSEILRIITVGRISPAKNINTLLKACYLLKEKGVQFKFKIIGPAIAATEEVYELEMNKLAKDLEIEEHIEWAGIITQANLPTELQSSDIFIHDGSTDSLDKALLEAVLCGCVVISSNPSYRGLTEKLAPELLYLPHDAPALSSIIKNTDQQSNSTRQQSMQPVYNFVHNSYSISNLISGIVTKY